MLFTDVVDSTRRLEGAGIDRWDDVIDHHRRSVAAVTAAHRGSVRTFTGDGFLVVFDDAGRGVSAALRLHYALWAQRELDVRIGVASGPVVPDEHLDVIGLCVHKAARLCAACEPGGVVIEEATYHAASASASLPPLIRGTLQLRGFRDVTRIRRAPAKEGASLA